MKSRSKKVSKSCGGNKSRQNKGKSKSWGGQKYRKSLGKRNSKRLGSLKKKAKKSNGRKRKHSNKRAKKQKGGYMLPTEYFGGDSKRFFEDAFVNKGASHEQYGNYKPQSYGEPFDDGSHGPNLYPQNMSSKQPKK